MFEHKRKQTNTSYEEFLVLRVTLIPVFGLYIDVTYEEFVASNSARLQAGLVAAYGTELGSDAAAEALAYGWEHWSKVRSYENPVGYLYRVGQTAVRRTTKRQGFLPITPADGMPLFEPELAPALERLTEPQRVAIILVHALGWPLATAAEVLNVSVSTLRTHIQRGMTKLRSDLKVETNAI